MNSLKNRVSIRQYSEQEISDELLGEILDCSRRASTSNNFQAYSVIVVRDPATKQRLTQLTGGQSHVADCPVFLAFCADLHRLRKASQLADVDAKTNLESFLVATVDAALVGGTVQTVAESRGLGSVMIGGIRNHPLEAAELLNLPSEAYIVFGMCLGWPDAAATSSQKPRLQQELVIHRETYRTADITPKLREYDEALAHHYDQKGGSNSTHAWTGPISQHFAEPRRAHLRPCLNQMGFNFE